jgi:predicted transcriptional regulator
LNTKFEKVTATELTLLKLLWEYRELTIRELTEYVYPQSTAPQYATVQKLLERLEAKGYVTRTRESRAHRFSTLVDRSEFLGGELQALANNLCEGSITPLLTTMVQNNDFTAEDLASLRSLVDRMAEATNGSEGEA